MLLELIFLINKKNNRKFKMKGNLQHNLSQLLPKPLLIKKTIKTTKNLYKQKLKIIIIINKTRIMINNSNKTKMFKISGKCLIFKKIMKISIMNYHITWTQILRFPLKFKNQVDLLIIKVNKW